MAILITKDLEVQGISVDQLYLRTNLYLDFSGDLLKCKVFPYYDKTLFVTDQDANILNIPILKKNYTMSYGSSINGDVLVYSHNQIVSELSTDIYEDVPVLDPSTGEYQYDPSTGELITESVISVPKFADISEITIVDLD